MGRYYGKEEYPSITTVISVLARFKGIDPEILARKAKLGSAVHKYTAAIDKGISWFPKGIPSKAQPYIDQWNQFKEDRVERIIWIEQPLISETFKFGGTLDRLLTLKGERFPRIAQIKTSTVIDRFTAMQVAAETLLAYENYKNKIDQNGMAVQLSPTGYRIPPLFENGQDVADAVQGFMYCLWLYHYLRERRD